MNIINQIQPNNKMYIILFIILLSISTLQYFDTKIIISFAVILFIYVNYETIVEKTKGTDEVIINSKKDEIAEDMYYNTPIQELLDKFKKYKKYNKISYKQGVKYLRKFFKTIHILENPSITNYNQYFENASSYLKMSINNFQSISVSFSEKSFINSIKYDNSINNKAEEIGKLCKELYNQCYYILLNLSIKFNKEWATNPHIYIKEIDMNPDRIEHHDEMIDVNWSLY